MQLWKDSAMAQERKAELDAATEACKALNLNVGTAGFIARHTYVGGIPKTERAGTIRFTEEEEQALARYNKALALMKSCKEDYIFAQIRQYHEEAKAAGAKPVYFTHACPRSDER